MQSIGDKTNSGEDAQYKNAHGSLAQVSPPSDRVPEPRGTGENSQCEKSNGSHKSRPVVDLPWSFDIVAVIVMFATVAAAVIAGIQLHLTRQTFQIGQRAWVTVRTGQVFPLPLTTGSVFSATLFNSGQSPALEMRVIEGGRSMTAPCADHSHSDVVPTDIQSVGPLAPNDEASQGFRLALKPEEIADIEADRRSVFYYGGVEYLDIFRTKHVTRFCLAYGQTTKIRPVENDSADPPIGMCTCHNEVD